MSPRIPSARVHTSGPDQALLTTRLSNGDRIRMGRVQPMAERMGRHWLWDVSGGCVAMLVIVIVMVSL